MFPPTGDPGGRADLVRLDDAGEGQPGELVFATTLDETTTRNAVYAGSAITVGLALAASTGYVDGNWFLLWFMIFGLVSLVETAVFLRSPERSVRVGAHAVTIATRRWPLSADVRTLPLASIAGIEARAEDGRYGTARRQVGLRLAAGGFEPLYTRDDAACDPAFAALERTLGAMARL